MISGNRSNPRPCINLRVVKYEAGPKTLQGRASTVNRGQTRKGRISGRYEAGSENLEREV